MTLVKELEWNCEREDAKSRAGGTCIVVKAHKVIQRSKGKATVGLNTQ